MRKEQEVFNIIKNYVEKNKFAPSVREICDLVGLSSTASVQRYIVALEKKAYIKRIHARAIKILKNEYN